MLKVYTHTPKYVHSLCISNLPEEYREFVREVSQEDSYRMYDYQDGDYYYIVNLNLATLDQTPDEILEKYVEEEEPTDTYPFKEWERHVYGGMELFEYVRWLRLVRFLVANLPPEVVTMNKFAIHVSH